MKILSSYKTTDGAQGHREGAKNGIRLLKNHWIYPESGSNAKIEKLREGAGWIKIAKFPHIIQIKLTAPGPSSVPAPEGSNCVSNETV